MHKYFRHLDPNDCESRFQRSVIDKSPKPIWQPNRKKRTPKPRMALSRKKSSLGSFGQVDRMSRQPMKKGSYLHKLYKVLGKTDWAESPVYH